MHAAPEPGRWTHRARRHLRPGVLVAVALGGALGCPLRYELAVHFRSPPGTFPWTTFAINVSGSFVLGVLLTLVLERWPPTRYVRPFLAIGALGAYTTFSTYSVEADLLFKEGAVALGVVYVVTSLLVGVTAVYLGIVTGRLRPSVRRSTR